MEVLAILGIIISSLFALAMGLGLLVIVWNILIALCGILSYLLPLALGGFLAVYLWQAGADNLAVILFIVSCVCCYYWGKSNACHKLSDFFSNLSVDTNDNYDND